MANNIRHYRQRKGISQQQLADLIGRTQPEVSRWEKGKDTGRDLTVSVLSDIAKALGARPEEIISNESDAHSLSEPRFSSAYEAAPNFDLPTFIFGIAMDAVIREKTKLSEEFKKAFFKDLLRRAYDETKLYGETRLNEKAALILLREMIRSNPENANTL